MARLECDGAGSRGRRKRRSAARPLPAAADASTLDFFLGEKSPEYFAREAARQAIVQLGAVEAPAGEMTVVLGPGWPGILLHEAVGHGLEADFNRKGVSAFSGRIGQQVASPLCTVIDDGSIGSRRGSLNMDDEGTPTQRNVLIENGVLRGYLQDQLAARLMKSASTGSGRRESYQHIPMPRMTNTYMLAGESDAGGYRPQRLEGRVLRGVSAAARWTSPAAISCSRPRRVI